MKRIPASVATCERLQQPFDGQSEVEDVKGALVREAVRLIVEEALEGEVADALGRAGTMSQIESGSWTAVTEDALSRIATTLGVEPWVILAQAAGLKLDDVERFTEDERIWLDAFRALDPEQRETILRVAMVMRRPSPRRKRPPATATMPRWSCRPWRQPRQLLPRHSWRLPRKRR